MRLPPSHCANRPPLVRAALLAALGALGCDAPARPAPAPPPPAPSAAIAGAASAAPRRARAWPDRKRCDERDGLFDGGSYLRADDGVALWFKEAGNPRGPATIYVHGGPCFGSYEFEKTAGPFLEKSLRMVYLDQRGCSRSASGEGSREANLTLDATLEDFERVRARLGEGKINLIAHSMGGLVALEYVRRHADRVGRLVLVDTSADVERALSHQIEYAASIAPEHFPDKAEKVRALARDPRPVTDRLHEIHDLLGGEFFRLTFYGSDREQDELGRLTGELRAHCHSDPMDAWYFKTGYLDSPHPELLKPLPVRTLFVAGARSQATGAENVAKAVAAWGAEVRTFETSGHFVHVAEPERFADVVSAFLTGRDRAR